jgi:tetratricopeptide (TPR) repeat protein
MRRVLWILAPLLSWTASAQMEFANCHQVEGQLRTVKGPLGEPQRSALFNALYSELSQLELEARKPAPIIPVGLLRHCLNSKREAFSTNLRYAAPGFRMSPDVQWKLAQMAEIQGNDKQALDFYGQIVQRDPTNAEARMKFFQLWIKAEKARVAATPSKAMNLNDFQTYVDKVVELLNPIIENPTAAQRLRLDALETRAEFYLEYKQVLLALADWKRILELDPSNRNALEYLAAFHLDRKMMREARVYLERLTRVDPSNVRPAITLLRIQFDQEDYSSTLQTSLIAQKNHPDNLDVMGLRARSLYENGRRDEAEDLVNAVLRKEPKNSTALNIKARQAEAEGDKYSSQQLYGNALQNYERAARLLSGEPRTADRVNRKMAFMIFDLRKKDNFNPKEASAKDMDQVLRLLKSPLDGPNPDPSLMKIAIEAADHSSDSRKGLRACDQLANAHFSLLDAEQVIVCARIQKAAGRRLEAESLINRALEASKFETSKTRLLDAKRKLQMN